MVLPVKPENHPIGKTLLQLAGIQNPALMFDEDPDQASSHRVFLTYNDLLWRRPHSATGLLTLLNSYFQAPVTLNLFQGQWRTPMASELSLIGNAQGRYNTLGKSMILGEKVWDQAAGVLITLGPVPWSLYQSFLPISINHKGGHHWHLLKKICKLYVGYDVDLRLKLVLKTDDVKPLALNRGFALGLNSWLNPTMEREFAVTLKLD